MRLRLDFAASVPKDPTRQDLNEDVWATEERVTRVAVSDGASESFDSRTWARLLVEKYILDPEITPAWVSGVAAEYKASVDYEQLSWSKQAAYDRGSFASLLAIELALNGTEVEVLAVGDSVAMHTSSELLLSSFPYTTPEEFDSRPELLSTLTAANKFISEPEFFNKHSSKTWAVKSGDYILLMTDAVAQWVLREQMEAPSALLQMLEVTQASAFEELVLKMRQERRIRLDDSTLVRLAVEEE